MLVSTQAKITKMEVYELNHDSIGDQSNKINESLISMNKEKVLCDHCKRTASNGIRCLGICVSDNDY